jgi:peroxiredoxin
MTSDIALGKQAPDFVLNNFKAEPIQLLKYLGTKNVTLAFLRGFM